MKKVKNAIALSMSIREHYLHRECPCTSAYGLFNDNDRMVGVIIYGCPASMTLKMGICGKDEADHVIELKRLFVEDGVDNFPESLLIGQSLKLMRKDYPDLDIIVSYADMEYDHVGTVYQATNWIYTGLSAMRMDYYDTENDDDLDHFTISDKILSTYGTIAKAREILGDRLQMRPRGLKHRYIFFNTKSKKRKEYLQSELKYSVLPYPKSDVHGNNKGSCQNYLDRWMS